MNGNDELAVISEYSLPATNAVSRFHEVLQITDVTAIVRDASIQRFEFSFEAVWKYAKEYLRVVECVEVASPKSVIRACRETGALTDGQTALALKMVDDRNLTAHTYNEEVAVKIFAGLSGYCELMRSWMENIAKKS